MTDQREFREKSVTIMGLGEFGGGLGAVRFFAEAGARILLTDLKPAEQLTDSLKEFDPTWQVSLRLGEHREADFRKTDLVVVSPAVPKDSPFLQIARDACVPVTSEMNLFWERNRGQVVAVTGSNGKSTTTAMIHTILSTDFTASGQRRCWLGGNIGISLLPHVAQITPDDWVVLELSSFQLDDLARLRPRPQIAVVTNFSPNHLDRHGTVAAYRAAKQQLLRCQTADQFAVLNHESEAASWPTGATRIWFGPRDPGVRGVFGPGPEVTVRSPRGFAIEQRVPLQSWLRLPGKHNWQNAQAAMAAALAVDVSMASIAQGIANFSGLPHRLEFVGEVAGRRCINDSKSTTPESTILALQAFDEPIVLLAGGYDKQIDLTEMAASIASRCKSVALLGQTGPQLSALIDHANRTVGRSGPSKRCFDALQAAVRWSLQESSSGEIVLLSPGCASFDWFRNYIDRGEQFRELINAQRTPPQPVA